MAPTITIIILAIVILSALHVVVGFSTVKIYSSEYNECRYLWGYELTSLILSVSCALVGIGSLVFSLLLTDAAKKRTIIYYMTTQSIPLLWGSYILYKIDDDCKDHYQSDATEVWELFIGTFVYSCVIWGCYTLINIGFFFNTIFCSGIKKIKSDDLTNLQKSEANQHAISKNV